MSNKIALADQIAVLERVIVKGQWLEVETLGAALRMLKLCHKFEGPVRAVLMRCIHEEAQAVNDPTVKQLAAAFPGARITLTVPEGPP